MRQTMRLLPLLAAACFAAAACQQESVTASDNEIAANSAGGANSADSTNGADAAAPAASGQRAGGSAPAIPAAAGGVPTGGVCGGIAGAQCASAGDYCQTKAGQCDIADAQGTCTTKPEICTQQYDPVCGCDGKTYGNACQAAATGVNVDSRGECRKP